MKKRYMTRSENIAYGIQSWLVNKGWCCKGTKLKEDEYEALLKSFCESRSDWNPALVKGMQTYEGYIDKRFVEFASYCGNKFKKEEA